MPMPINFHVQLLALYADILSTVPSPLPKSLETNEYSFFISYYNNFFITRSDQAFLIRTSTNRLYVRILLGILSLYI
jgi:hypothetical protein